MGGTCAGGRVNVVVSVKLSGDSSSSALTAVALALLDPATVFQQDLLDRYNIAGVIQAQDVRDVVAAAAITTVVLLFVTPVLAGAVSVHPAMLHESLLARYQVTAEEATERMPAFLIAIVSAISALAVLLIALLLILVYSPSAQVSTIRWSVG